MINTRKSLIGIDLEEKNKMLKISNIIPMNYDEVYEILILNFYLKIFLSI
jgi:hypothetical protein